MLIYSMSVSVDGLIAVVGGGTPFLPPVAEAVPPELIETRTFGSRVIVERYGRGVRHESAAAAARRADR